MTHVDDDDRTLPPHDTEAERMVLGSVLRSQAVMAGLQHLRPADFYDRRNGAIWHAMLDLWERAVAIDYATLANRLKADDLAAARVGLLELSEISVAVPSAAHAEHYARIVIDTATQRRYISVAQQIAVAAWKPGLQDIGALVSEVEALIQTARPSDTRRDLYDPAKWAQSFWDDLEQRQSGQRTAVMTGLLDLDDMTLGLETGRLYLLMGLPGHGKTELALQIAINVADQHGPVLFASLEMSAVELAQRYARIVNALDRNRLAVGKNLSQEEWALVAQTMNQMHDGRLWPASPRGTYTTGDLRADVLEMQAKHGKPAMIVADYVQRFRDRASRYSNREENVGLVAENLKSLAREFGCPVLAPVQPNRDHKLRPSDPRPKLTDLRESGKLEQEADVVLGLYRDEKHNRESSDRGIMEIHMLKNRSGVGDTDGVRRIVWCGTRYENYAPLPTGAWAA